MFHCARPACSGTPHIAHYNQSQNLNLPKHPHLNTIDPRCYHSFWGILCPLTNAPLLIFVLVLCGVAVALALIDPVLVQLVRFADRGNVSAVTSWSWMVGLCRAFLLRELVGFDMSASSVWFWSWISIPFWILSVDVLEPWCESLLLLS